MNENWFKVELHLHTVASNDSLITPIKLLKRCNKLGINRVAITDHNSIEGALAAKTLDPDRIIIGEEIQTTQGELLGYFLTDWVPPGLEPLDAIERLRKQGAVISVAHPFDNRGSYWTLETLNIIAPYIDAVEVFNARCSSNKINLTAAGFAKHHGLLGTVGSDAHSLPEIGRAILNMPPFDDRVSFLKSLAQGKANTRLSSPLVHLLSRYAFLKSKIHK